MKEDIRLLEEVFDKTTTGSRMLGAVLPHVENRTLRIALLTQISEYDMINKEAGEEISALGQTPKARHPMKRSLSCFGAGVSAAVNPSISNIAQMAQDASNKGVINITKAMNSCVNSSPRVYNLARKLVTSEEENEKRMKSFL